MQSPDALKRHTPSFEQNIVDYINCAIYTHQYPRVP